MNKFGYVTLLLAGMASAQTIYPTMPDWRSTDRHFATGGAFADINRDGWLDFVVANGNDMARERVAVYFSNAGVLQMTPGWQSNEARYHGHIAVGDINQDGWTDVAVAVLWSEGGPGVKVYLNQNGTLSNSQSWASANSFYGWHVALGDPDADGDLDLLVGSSDAYGSGRWPNYIFFNNGGTLETTPSWQTADTRNLDHMEFCDVDDDGDLDIVAIGSQTANWIYRNHYGVINQTPDWNSVDNANQMANTLAIGDVSGDGRPDLVMSDNNQISNGSGRFKLYRGTRYGIFEPTYSWSYFDGYVSAVALADVNNDGRLDLTTGAWWDRTRLFLNSPTGLSLEPSWNSALNSVVEAIVFGDVNRDGLATATVHKDIYTGKTILATAKQSPYGLATDEGIMPTRRLYSIGRQPIERVIRVVVDGNEVPYSYYCANLMNGWVSLRKAPTRSVAIEYEYSTKLDMGVTDWENNGNVIYLHR